MRHSIMRKTVTVIGLLLLGGLSSYQQAMAESEGQDPDRQTHGDWTLRCQARDNALPCDMVQQIIDKPSGKQVLAISIAWSPKEQKHALQIVVPLGIWLEPGLAIKIGEDFSVDGVRLSRCEPSGCFVEAVMEDTLLDAMKAGSEGAIILMDMARKPAVLPFSLKGFTAAHKALQSETVARVNMAAGE